jgi:ankyrin repeat protein
MAPLHIASLHRQIDIVLLLLNAGSVKVNDRANDGSTPLDIAVVQGCIPVSCALLDRGGVYNHGDASSIDVFE